jgi:hypothetical protein
MKTIAAIVALSVALLGCSSEIEETERQPELAPSPDLSLSPRLAPACETLHGCVSWTQANGCSSEMYCIVCGADYTCAECPPNVGFVGCLGGGVAY